MDYALTHTPVVITGEVEEMTAQPWTFDHLSKVSSTHELTNPLSWPCCQVIGHMTAPLKRMVSGSVQWARLESAGQCTVEEFIESLDNSSPESDSKFVLCPNSLHTHNSSLEGAMELKFAPFCCA